MIDELLRDLVCGVLLLAFIWLSVNYHSWAARRRRKLRRSHLTLVKSKKAA